MRIKAFSYLVENNARAHSLQNTSLVIDAQNFFYDHYEESGLNFHFGAEGDQYADYLKKNLDIFKKNNVKCFFVFKGGTKNLLKKIEKDQKRSVQDPKKKCNPIFINDIHLQVLEEMGFDYVFTEFEAKPDCIALARKLSCPVLSQDIEFAFSGVPYIPISTLEDENKGTFKCKIFLLSDFLRKYSVNKNIIEIFILVSDESIFPENSFTTFFTSQRIPPHPNIKRHVALLQWLSKRNKSAILREIYKNTEVQQKKILEERAYVKTLLEPEFEGPLAMDYRANSDDADIRWFEKGIALNFVPKPYIDVYRSNLLLCNIPQDRYNSMKSSVKIIKYAYDLLTNFQNDGMQFLINHSNPENLPVVIKESIRKPNYQANVSVFENGWDNVRSLGLFQHFMIEAIDFKFDRLENAPAEANLLLIALVYFHHQKTCETSSTKLTYSILLSYIMLGVVNVVNKNGNAPSVENVSLSDCKSAACLLKDYFEVTPDDIAAITDKNLINSVYEFQHCLREINNLNRLCGNPFQLTVYGRTFHGTFVHKLLHVLETEEEPRFFDNILGTAPTVLAYLFHLFELYQTLL